VQLLGGDGGRLEAWCPFLCTVIRTSNVMSTQNRKLITQPCAVREMG
jgi:hypothetical protein